MYLRKEFRKWKTSIRNFFSKYNFYKVKNFFKIVKLIFDIKNYRLELSFHTRLEISALIKFFILILNFDIKLNELITKGDRKVTPSSPYLSNEKKVWSHLKENFSCYKTK